MDSVTQVQFQDEAVYIPLSTDTLVKGMNQTILSLAIGKIVGQTKLISLRMTTDIEEGILWIQTC